MIRKNIFTIIISVCILASFSIAQMEEIGGRVVFVSNRGGNENLWIYDLSTNETHQLTNFSGWNTSYPRWSPDGKMVAFIGKQPTDQYGKELYIINDDGTNLRQLTLYPTSIYANRPAWDPNSIEYVFYSKVWPAARSRVHKVYIDTLDDIEIPPYRGDTTRICDITTDGTEILFWREQNCCWRYNNYTGYQDFGGTYERILKPPDGKADRQSRINRDNNWIIYSETGAGSQNPTNIYKMDEFGNNVTQLTFGVGGERNRFVVWARGGNEGSIIFDSNMYGNSEILLMRAIPSEYPGGIINITMDPSYDSCPDWTPIPFNKPPIAVCKNIEISAEGNCYASIIAEDVDGGSYDPDEDDTITLSVDNIGPFPIGEHYVNLTVTDGSGESDTCQAIVIVVDAPDIADSAVVDPSATIGDGSTIGPHAEVKEGAKLGICVVMEYHSVVEKYVEVGSYSLIGKEAKVEEYAVLGSACSLGEKVVVKKHAVLGRGVMVGANSVLEVEVSVGDDTVIGNDTKVEEHVVIGSNCQIGNNVLIKKEAQRIPDGTVIPDGAVIG